MLGLRWPQREHSWGNRVRIWRGVVVQEWTVMAAVVAAALGDGREDSPQPQPTAPVVNGRPNGESPRTAHG